MRVAHTKLTLDSALSVCTKAAEVLISLLVVVLLGRLLGAEGFGVYAFALAIVSMASMPTRLGLPQLVVRETASGQAAGHWEAVVGIWRWSTAASVILGLVVAVIGISLILVLGRATDATGITLAIGLLLVPLLSLANLRAGILRGLRHVGAANLTGLLAQPALLAVLLLGFILVSDERLTPPQAISLTVVSALFAFILGAWIIQRKRPPEVNGVAPKFMPCRWLSATWPMAMTQGAHQINRYVDVIILGLLATMIDAGIYRIAAQGAILVSLGTVAMGLVTAPWFAHLHAVGNQMELQRLLWRSSQFSLLLSVIVTLGFAFAGKPVLTWLFGEEFQNAWAPLMILAC